MPYGRKPYFVRLCGRCDARLGAVPCRAHARLNAYCAIRVIASVNTCVLRPRCYRAAFCAPSTPNPTSNEPIRFQTSETRPSLTPWHFLTSSPLLLALRKLPPIPTNRTLTKRRHRLIRTPRLRLTITHLLLPTFATLQLTTNALFNLRHHCLLHCLFPQFLVFFFQFIAFELFGCHASQAAGGNGPGDDALAELGVGFGF